MIPIEERPNIIHGEGGVFPTSSGRVEFYWENPAPNSNFGQKFDVEKERLPYWEPPAEAWPVGVEGYPANPLGEKYPLMLFNRHTKWRSHSTYCYTPNLRLLDPEPRAFLSVVDAEARGIEEGDTVKVFNDRGHVVLRARLDNGMRPGMVSVPHGWQSDQFIEGHYANLTSSAYNPICVNGCFNDSLVEVEKA